MDGDRSGQGYESQVGGATRSVRREWSSSALRELLVLRSPRAERCLG
jgi:hypothetical protein